MIAWVPPIDRVALNRHRPSTALDFLCIGPRHARLVLARRVHRPLPSRDHRRGAGGRQRHRRGIATAGVAWPLHLFGSQLGPQ